MVEARKVNLKQAVAEYGLHDEWKNVAMPELLFVLKRRFEEIRTQTDSLQEQAKISVIIEAIEVMIAARYPEPVSV